MAVTSLHGMIAISLILAMAIPSSLGRREHTDIEKDLRDLCSQTRRSKDCWKIMKHELGRFEDTDSRTVVGVAIDLARAKADEIHDQLYQYHDASRDDRMKDRYLACSENYSDAGRDLDLAKEYFHSNDYRSIPVLVDDTLQELKGCRHQFRRDSFDPAHISNRNKELGVYVDIVKVASDRLMRENDHN